MPLVRIDLARGRSEAQRRAIADAVHKGLVSVIGIPQDDRFQVIGEHDPANFIFPDAYLGLAHTQHLVIIQITLSEGRSTELKQALFKAIAEGIHAAADVPLEDVIVNLVEVKKENWSFGGGVAQYVQP
jgi:phenylpyruvate tautomerase PptA (4-oxalocrotonate tautomerase family)